MRKLGANVCEQDKADIARAFVERDRRRAGRQVRRGAASRPGSKRLVVAGGVGANRQLREALDGGGGEARLRRATIPELELCTDNGAMIALAGALRLARWPEQAVRDYAFTVKPRWDLASLASA